MGLRFFKRRNTIEKITYNAICQLLQWGCAFSSAEIQLIFYISSLAGGASMGLRFFKRRNQSAEVECPPFRLLASMGLRFFKRRNRGNQNCNI